HEALRLGLVALALGGANGLGGGVAARLEIVQLRGEFPRVLVEGENFAGVRTEPAAGEAGVEGVGVIPYFFQVVHGAQPIGRLPGSVTPPPLPARPSPSSRRASRPRPRLRKAR